jgi:signal transduction histidine kinase
MTELDFKVSAGLKDIIGNELITNDNIAIFELVKNSYDAKAKNVWIIFQDINDQKKSKIVIIDDGKGMNYNDLKEKWLFVGYSEKKDFEKELEKSKGDYKRMRMLAGAKGVGRFSCDRLGKKLDLYSKRHGEKDFNHIIVDWKSFENVQEKLFQKIPVEYSTINKIPLNLDELDGLGNGTVLEIAELRESWDWEKLSNLKKYLQRLINPSNPTNTQDFNIILEVPEYIGEDEKHDAGEQINGPIKNTVLDKLRDNTTNIECVVDESHITTELVDKGEFIFKMKEENEYNLKNVKISIFYLNQSAKVTFKRIMGIQTREYGSIFLYKNDFRVHPYGDMGDDWLGLESRKGQGYRRYLANREIIGRIELLGPHPEFKEVSSRERVVENEYYKQLKKLFIEKALHRLEKYVVEAIDWDRVTGEIKTPEEVKEDSIKVLDDLVGSAKNAQIEYSEDLIDIIKGKKFENVSNVIKNLETILGHVGDKKLKDHMKKQIKSLRINAKMFTSELRVTEKKELFLEKALSTDKELLLEMNHSIQISTVSIKDIISEINEKISESAKINTIISLVDELDLENNKIKTFANIVSLANFNAISEWIEADIVKYITDYLAKIKTKTMAFRFYNDDKAFLTRFRPLEISVALDNFINNSKKAKASIMTIDFKVENKKLHVYVSDNGLGVKNGIEEHIFQRGYTTTSGSGIGLYQIRKIFGSMGGEVKFVGNSYNGLGKGACFEVLLK